MRLGIRFVFLSLGKEMFNSKSYHYFTFAGKVLNVQTVSYKMSSSNQSIDIERTEWHKEHEREYKFLNVIFVFFEKGPSAQEVIGRLHSPHNNILFTCRVDLHRLWKLIAIISLIQRCSFLLVVIAYHNILCVFIFLCIFKLSL